MRFPDVGTLQRYAVEGDPTLLKNARFSKGMDYVALDIVPPLYGSFSPGSVEVHTDNSGRHVEISVDTSGPLERVRRDRFERRGWGPWRRWERTSSWTKGGTTVNK